MPLTLKYGVTIGPFATTANDLATYRSLGFGAVRLLCGVHPPQAIAAYRSVGAFILQARIVYPEIAEGRSPAQFVNERREAIAAFFDNGLGDFEILNDPNLSRGGYGRSWNSPRQFNDWFLQALDRLRALFPNARFGFPGLSPGVADLAMDPQVGRPMRPVGDIDFIDSCREAVGAASFLCVQTYWQNAGMMRDIDAGNTGFGGLRWLRIYHERFPNASIAISEFCNNRPGIGIYAPNDAQWRVIGDEYAEFYTLCAQYEFVEAAFARTLRDSAHPDQSWLTESFQERRIIEGVRARPRPPEPEQLQLGWPTQFRRITQPYGLRQLDYSRISGGALRGGHEGVDIAAPSGSDIYACLPGVVSRSEASRGPYAGGYGAYGEVIAVDSDVPGVGKVTLTYAHLSRRLVFRGRQIKAGERLGLAGVTGNAQGAHLHLSMRVANVPLYAQLDYLNPGPYLNLSDAPTPPPPPAPGAPRVQYERTVVLLPPPAGLDFVEAVLRATWDRKRYTVGGSADDGGIGDLDRRRVIAVNPGQWNGDLFAWYQRYYPGIDYAPLNAATPAALGSILQSLNLGSPNPWAGPNRGAPREQYARTYILIPPPRGLDFAIAAARATWAKYRVTIGGSADDGGIGGLANRRVVAINPNEWGGDLQGWYQQNYPGVEYIALSAIGNADQLIQALRQFYP